MHLYHKMKALPIFSSFWTGCQGIIGLRIQREPKIFLCKFRFFLVGFVIISKGLLCPSLYQRTWCHKRGPPQNTMVLNAYFIGIDIRDAKTINKKFLRWVAFGFPIPIALTCRNSFKCNLALPFFNILYNRYLWKFRLTLLKIVAYLILYWLIYSNRSEQKDDSSIRERAH